MARPQDLSKAQTSMVTIEDLQPDGSFSLVDNDGVTVGNGRARVSNRHPGYVTLALSVYTPAIRVPAEWLRTFGQ
jgi:hypothetical protein